MGVNTPLISVVMITYNHENYITEAIQSVLDQTFTDFELIIINDGSIDKTDEIIRIFQDSRIVYIHQKNQGPSAATNNGILAARGKYIALMSGDDVSYPQRLERQYQYLDTTGKKIVFSWVDFIDDDSQPLVGEHFAKDWFNHTNRTRAEILNWFFINGNYLCAVTALIEREILLEAGLFHSTSIQLQDFDMWIKLVKKHDIFILTEKLVKYRIRDKGNNLSHPDNFVRSVFEGYQIYKNMLDGFPIELFKEAFKNKIKKSNFKEGIEYELEKAFLYLSHSFSLIQSIGCEKLFNLLQNKDVLSIANTKYSFGLPELYELTKDIDITNSRLVQHTQTQLEHYQSQLQQAQVTLEQTQSQLQQAQVTLEQTQSQLQDTQAELERSQSQLQQTQAKLENTQAQLQYSQSQLQHTQAELERSQSQLQQTQAKLENTQAELQCSQSQLQHTQSELHCSQSQLQHTQSELHCSRDRIKAMESSKFWKLRKAWFKLKLSLGLKGDE